MKLAQWRLPLFTAVVAAIPVAAVAVGVTGQAALASSGRPRIAAIPAQHSVLGQQANLQVRATAQAGNLSYKAADLPPGLSINHRTGKVTGKPRVTAGTWKTKVTATANGLSASVSFRWHVASIGGEVTGYDGKCLDDFEGRTLVGTKVDIWTCDGKQRQAAGFMSNGELGVHGRCVTGPGKVHVEPCGGWKTEIWQRRANGEYVLKLNGECLTDPSSSKVNGRQLVLARCVDAPGQRWSLPKPQPPVVPVMTVPGTQHSTLGSLVTLRMRATAASTITWRATGLPYGLSINKRTGMITGRPGVTVGTWETQVIATSGGRSAGVSLRWLVTSPPGELRSLNSSCLDDYGHTWGGSRVGSWACDGTSSQLVTFGADGGIVVNGMCLTGPGMVTLEPCQETASQTWRRQPDGEYVLKSDGQCLTDPSASQAAGRQLALAACAGTSGQLWSAPVPQPAAPAVPPPTGQMTTPASAYAPGDPPSHGCGAAPADLPWVGATDVYGGSSMLSLRTLITPANANGTVQARYSMWDDGTVVANPAGTNGNGGAGDLSSSHAGPAVTDTGLDFILTDGHRYTWTAAAITTNPDGSQDVSATAPVCGFQVDSTPPAAPTVASSNSGNIYTFTFGSTDPVPACGGCAASGVYEFAYSLNRPLPANLPASPVCADGAVPASSPDGAATATSCPVQVGDWGTNILYVEAIDKAGNISTAEYYFYVPYTG